MPYYPGGGSTGASKGGYLGLLGSGTRKTPPKKKGKSLWGSITDPLGTVSLLSDVWEGGRHLFLDTPLAAARGDWGQVAETGKKLTGGLLGSITRVGSMAIDLPQSTIELGAAAAGKKVDIPGVGDVLREKVGDITGQEVPSFAEEAQERGLATPFTEAIGWVAGGAGAAAKGARVAAGAGRTGRLATAIGLSARTASRVQRLERFAQRMDPLAHPYQLVAKVANERVLKPALVEQARRAAPTPEVDEAVRGYHEFTGRRFEAGPEGVTLRQAEAPRERFGLTEPEGVSVHQRVDPRFGRQVAEAYEQMPEGGPEWERARDSFVTENDEQWRYLTDPKEAGGLGVKVSFVDQDPYATPEELFADMQQGQLKVWKTQEGQSSPGLTDEQNNRFRAVHDAFGHSRLRNKFDRHGEEIAYQAHRQMYSSEARKFLATETRGQNMRMNYGPGEGFPVQKAGLLPEELREGTARSPLAQRLERAPNVVVDPLARAGKVANWLEVRRRTFEHLRGLEIAKRAAFLEPGLQRSISAARILLEANKRLTRTEASGIVHDLIDARLTGKSRLQDQWRAAGVSEEAINRATRTRHPVPPEFRQADGTLVPELETAVQQATAAWAEARLKHTQQLMESQRLGNRGLENIESVEAELTKADLRGIKQAQRLYERGERLRTGAAGRQRNALATRVAAATDEVGRLGKSIAELADARLSAIAEFDLSRLPDAFKPDNWSAHVAAMAAKIMEDGGFTFDPHTQTFVSAPTSRGRYATGAVPGTAKKVTLAEFAADPVGTIDEFARQYQQMFQRSDIYIGAWHNRETGFVHLDPAQVFHSRDEALLYGAARHQEAITDFVSGDPTVLDDIAVEERADIAAQFIGKGRGTKRAVSLGQLRARLERDFSRLTPADIDAHANLWDNVAVAMHAAGHLAKPDDLYGVLKWRTTSAVPRDFPAGKLFQTILDRDMDIALWNDVQAGLGGKNGAQLKKALNWYFEGHDTIVKAFEGKQVLLGNGTKIDAAELMFQLVAITSTRASPEVNLGNALAAMENMANYTRNGKKSLAVMEREFKRFFDLPEKEQTSDRLFQQLTGVREKGRKVPPESTAMFDRERRFVMEVLAGRTVDTWDDAYFEEFAKALSWKKVPEGADMQAWREYHGSAARAKFVSFYENLRDPINSEHVTLDTWMADALGLDHRGGFGGAKAAYGELAAKFRDVSARLSKRWGRTVRPHEVQAALWVYAKREIVSMDIGRIRAAGEDVVHAIRTGTWTAVPRPEWEQGADILESLDYDQAVGPYRDRVRDALEETLLHDIDRAAEVEEAKRLGLTKSVFRKGEQEVTVSTGKRRGKLTRKYQAATGVQGEKEAMIAAEYADVQRQAAVHYAQGRPELAAGLIDAWVQKRITRLSKRADGRGFQEAWDAPAGGGRIERIQARTKGQLFSQFEDQVFGAMWEGPKEGRYIGALFKRADFTTLLHEQAHALRKILPDQHMAVFDEVYGTKTAGGWDNPAVEERFVDDFLTYLNTHQAPHESLRGPFRRLRSTLKQTWAAGARAFEGQIDPRVEDFWNRILNPDPNTFDELDTLPHIPFEGASMATRAQIAPEAGTGPADYYRRGIRGGKSIQAVRDIERQIREKVSTQQKVRATLDDLKAQLAADDLPAVAEAARLDARAGRTLEKVVGSIENPSVARVPAPWQPVWAALKEMEAIAGEDPKIAAILGEGTTAFSEVIRRARAEGFTPAHVRMFTPSQVRYLVRGTTRLGGPRRQLGKEFAAGTRKKRQFLAGQREHSLEALMAASVEVAHEARTNAVVDVIDEFSQPINPGDPIPKGWTTWDERRTALITGEEGGVEKTGLLGRRRRVQTAGPAATRIIPESVAKSIDMFQADHDHFLWRIANKPTSAWRTAVLTLSPRWYVNNMIGGAIVATAGGVRLADWIKAAKAARKRDVGGQKLRFAELPQIRAQSFVSDIRGDESIIPRGDVSLTRPLEARRALAETAKREGFRAALDQFGERLRRGNEVVDEFVRAAIFFAGERKFKGDAVKATEHAFRAMVDYNNLDPFERSVVRALVPFYAWQKGILKVAVKLGVDHPLFVAIGAQLGELNRELMVDRYGTELPRAYDGFAEFPVLGTVNTRGLNPFEDAESLTSPEGVAASLNPFYELFARKVLGAPEAGIWSDDLRLTDFGSPQGDVDVWEQLRYTARGIPQVQAVEKGDTGIQRILGVSRYTDEEVQKIVDRTKRARELIAEVEGGSSLLGGLGEVARGNRPARDPLRNPPGRSRRLTGWTP